MGYKSEQFVKTVDENLFCSICHEVFQDPVSCKDGHTFCSECIEQWLKTSKKCPLDNSVITDKKLARNYIAKGIIDNLEVYCYCTDGDEAKPEDTQAQDKNKDDLKCDWTGKLQSLAKHRKTCPFQQVQCPNVNCNTNMQRRELEDHDKICEYKELECDEQCGVTLIRRDLPNHKRNDCPEVTLLCPNGCEASIKRKNIIKHREKCPFQQLQCPNENCIQSIERRELEDHDKICPFKRMECKKCKTILVRLEILYHKDFECPEEWVPCPSKCRSQERGQIKKTKRKDLDDHLRNECAKKILDCPLKDQGCSVQVERQHVDKHVQDNIAAHMMLLAKQCSSLTEQITVLTELNTRLTEQNTRLTEQNTRLTEQNTRLTEQNKTLTVQCSVTTKKCESLPRTKQVTTYEGMPRTVAELKERLYSSYKEESNDVK